MHQLFDQLYSFSMKASLIAVALTIIFSSGHIAEAGHGFFSKHFAPVGPGWYSQCAGCPGSSASTVDSLSLVPREFPIASLPKPLPPPGTIGRTFQLPSRPVPAEKHPRTGMLDVYIKDAEDVLVHDMNDPRIEQTIEGFRDAEDDNLWHFETSPLYPGLDHIYRVQATYQNSDGTTWKDARYVRLIMGRVVELDF